MLVLVRVRVLVLVRVRVLVLLVLILVMTCHGRYSEVGSALWWWDVIIDILFVMDMFVNFRTAYFDTNDTLIVSPCKIAIQYIKSWFIVDFFACFPFQYLAMLSDENEKSGGPSLPTPKIAT